MVLPGVRFRNFAAHPANTPPTMRHILILGAGRSASALVRYLITHAAAQDWRITVADRETGPAQRLIGDGTAVATALALDATDAAARSAAIARHDLVISMLPAFMHMDVLRDCLRLRKHVITPSYVPEDLLKMQADVAAAGLVVLNEMGLDPGIDHMSAMRIIHRIQAEGGRITAFESHTGGLVAPACDDNPWGYKFSWNPRNVVLAGQGGAARYVRDGVTRYTPYHQLFRRTDQVHVEGYGSFDAYANRDSLKYRAIYGLEGIPTLLRGTLRKAGYCAAWNVLVQLGCTDDGYTLELAPDATWSDYTEAFLPPGTGDQRERMARVLGLDAKGPELERIAWLGLFSRERIGFTGRSPAATLQQLLEQRWVLGASDRDMVVMWHRFVWEQEGRTRELHASLVVEGADPVDTAMARTVGLPIAMACPLVLNDRIRERGVLLPVIPAIYDPLLDELETQGVVFRETEVQR
jgi:saccharopine dehydrogenase-like NADP-dependent oxidoreductase